MPLIQVVPVVKRQKERQAGARQRAERVVRMREMRVRAARARVARLQGQCAKVRTT